MLLVMKANPIFTEQGGVTMKQATVFQQIQIILPVVILLAVRALPVIAVMITYQNI